MTLKSPAMIIGSSSASSAFTRSREPRHPGELVGEFLRADRVAVRQIDIDAGGARRRHRDDRLEIARLHVVWIAGKPRRHLVERELGEQRHAIEALLPVYGDVIAELLEVDPWGRPRRRI